jgi:hypothetical protein
MPLKRGLAENGFYGDIELFITLAPGREGDSLKYLISFRLGQVIG